MASGSSASTLTAERLREIVNYDPDTGIFTWKIPRGYRGSRGKPGDRAGHFNHVLGYRAIGIDGKTYYEHRLAILYLTGEWPKSVVDHKGNGSGFDNRSDNLRSASRSQNRANTTYKKKDTTSYLRGVSWHQGARKWQAHIQSNGVNMYLGLFLTEEEAHTAYCEAAKLIHGEFANV